MAGNLDYDQAVVVEGVEQEPLSLYGESKPQVDSHTFVWKIKHFLRTLELKKTLYSPMYEGNHGNEWQVRLKERQIDFGGPTSLGVHLYLKKLGPDADEATKEDGICGVFSLTVLDLCGSQLAGPYGGKGKKMFKIDVGLSCGVSLDLEALRAPESQLLVNGFLTLKFFTQIENRVMNRSCRTDQFRFAQPVEPPQNPLVASFHNLFDNPAMSDLIIEVGGMRINAHKTVLAARSPAFMEILSVPTDGRRTLQLTISTFDTDVVKTMIEYLYCGEIIDLDAILGQPYDALRIGVVYHLPHFLDLVDQLLAENMTYKNCLEILVAADVTDRHELVKKAAFKANWCKAKIGQERFQSLAQTAPQVFKHLYMASD